MGGPKGGVDKPPPIADYPYRQIVEADIYCDLFIAPAGQKSCDGIHVRNKSFKRHTRGHADQIHLGHSFHEVSVWEFGFEIVHGAGAEIAADEHHTVIVAGKLHHHIEACSAHLRELPTPHAFAQWHLV